MKDVVVIFFLLAGSFLSFLAALGIFRLPDLYSRMHAASKAGALGGGCLMVAAAVHFGDFRVTVESLLVIFFLVLTAPVAAHMISRAAYHTGEPLWKDSVCDDLEDPGASKGRKPGPGPANPQTGPRPKR